MPAVEPNCTLSSTNIFWNFFSGASCRRLSARLFTQTLSVFHRAICAGIREFSCILKPLFCSWPCDGKIKVSSTISYHFLSSAQLLLCINLLLNGVFPLALLPAVRPSELNAPKFMSGNFRTSLFHLCRFAFSYI